ncbi:holin [Photorhabdus luminescens]|uniref:Holin n=1 Tax=Photorhabdus akhurstii TaxID=171438 RepID=A0ABX8LSM2_9GAMM|nr:MULTISPECIES: phage holin family protein [Photorhabdus]KGM29101.1 holin [Photorhabdus luminescens]MBS9426792.1 holin [Photorhabdus akhurstii]MCC8456223.1 phage holin family protein [Photorhabdus aegyptia]PQQ32823.1 holin [Photorhabdus luminescens]PQQ35369.1 holin [Photorhabdus luminescens]
MKLMDKYTSPSAYCWGMLTAMLGALSLNDWALIIGIICTVGTFSINWHYKRKEFQLKRESRNNKDQD